MTVQLPNRSAGGGGGSGSEVTGLSIDGGNVVTLTQTSGGDQTVDLDQLDQSAYTLQDAYDASSDPDIVLAAARPVSLKSLSNSDATVLKITAQPLATPNIPYGAIEFQGSIDITTNSFNCGLIKSGFAAGSGFDKGYLTLSSPQTIGVWNDVLTVRNSRLGVGTTNPLVAYHTVTSPNSLLWGDGNNRNTAVYNRIDFVDADLTTGLSGLYGVEQVWNDNNGPNTRNVNATFFNLTLASPTISFGGGTHRAMVGQLTLSSPGGAVCTTVGMQGKIYLANAHAGVTTGQHTALESFIQGQVTGVTTVSRMNGFKSRVSLGGGNLAVTDVYHMYLENAGGAGTLTNQRGIWIENMAKGGTINQAIVLDGDGVGSEIIFGDGQDAELYYDGTDFIIDPDLVGTGRVLIGATGDDDMLLNDIEIDGDLNHDGAGVGFYATAPVAKQLAVPVTAAGVHAALVNLGLIT